MIMSLDAIIISDYCQASLSSSSPLRLNLDGRSADIQVVRNYLEHQGHVVPPVEGDGLMSWAAAPKLNGIFLYNYLTKNNFGVEIIDNYANERDSFIELLKENPKAVIISTTFIYCKKDLYRLVKDIRSLAPDIYIIAGGQFVYISSLILKRSREPIYKADAIMDDYLFFNKNEPDVDLYIISLRGEKILVEALNRLKMKRSFEGLPNSARLQGGAYVFSHETDDISCAEEFYIDWSSLPGNLFKSGVIPMQASTGCPHNCAYCNFTKDRRLLSVKPVEQLVKELKAVFHRGAQYVWFVDDNFRLGKRDLDSVCRRFVEEDINLQWMSFIRADTLQDCDFDLLRRSGCNELQLGLESADPQVLENMNKKVDPGLSAAMVRELLAVGINCSVYFVVGFPGETEETVQRTLDFLKSIEHPGLEGMICWSIYPFMLAPLSPVFEQEQRKKYGLSGYMYNWEHETMTSLQAMEHAKNTFFAIKDSGPIYRGDNMNHRLALPPGQRKRFAAVRHELSKLALKNQLQKDHIIKSFGEIFSGRK